eukprot:gene4218-4520_t
MTPQTEPSPPTPGPGVVRRPKLKGKDPVLSLSRG